MNVVIRSEFDRKLTFHSRSVREDGWVLGYVISAEAPNLQASREMGNPGYGESPARLFTDMAEEWFGWQGEKKWCSFEGEFELSATADSTGRITLIARLRSTCDGRGWEIALPVFLEAGSLERLAREVQEFFAPQPH